MAAPSRRLRIEWLAQTIASLCWIASVFSYGLSSTGDWLQLAAASAWLIANLATAMDSASPRPPTPVLDGGTKS